MQSSGIDVAFAVDVSNDAAAATMVTQANAYATSSSSTLVTQLQSSGLSGVTAVTLTQGAGIVKDSDAADDRADSTTSDSSGTSLVVVVGVLVGIFLICPGVVIAIMSMCCKPVLRKWLLRCGCKFLADRLVPDVFGEMRELKGR